MISKDQEATIIRLGRAEKWRVGTIAHQLGIHHSTVRRVLEQAGLPSSVHRQRPSKADAFIPFIEEVLAKFPKLCASRIYQMAVERGYVGGPDHFRSIVARLRPRKVPEAFLRLRTLPGDQGQVDWAHFGSMTIGRAVRPLSAFVMVLSWSRMVFVKFFLDQKLPNLMRGHQAAFEFFGGIPRTLLYDNPRTIVLERQGDAIRFHPTLLEFAGHHRYAPRPVAVARGNEKGRVERSIRYVRTSFFAARSWASLDDLNEQALAWCLGEAANRLCPEDRTMTVRAAFAAEQSKLIVLPDNPYPTHDREEVIARKQPYVRFDLNDYSIPHHCVGKPLVLVADLSRVRIIDGLETIADHPRSFDKEEQVEVRAHVEALEQQKRKARALRGVDVLVRRLPSVSRLLEEVARRSGNLASATNQIRRLVDEYGADAVDRAIGVAMERGTPHANALKFLLEQERLAHGRPVPIPVELPDDPRVRDVAVRPHALETYDAIKGVGRSDDPK